MTALQQTVPTGSPQRPTGPLTRLLGVSVSTPAQSFTQAELLTRFGLHDPIAVRVFEAPHIARRHLILPTADAAGQFPHESATMLQEKFKEGALAMGSEAISAAARGSGVSVEEIEAIVCVTSTGFMVPGLSCLFVRELGMRHTCRRIDVVGMGCNAGLNGLAALDGWAVKHPGSVGVLVCCEVNSAMYCPRDTARDGVVNSLFADGTAAIVVRADSNAGPEGALGPAVLDFESHMIPEEWRAMSFEWDDETERWRFFLGRNIPYILGVHCAEPVNRLLGRNGVRRHDVEHWIIHTGGGAVIDAIRHKLGLTEHDVRHTRSVLRDYGNVSSGSFLFSYSRLLGEGAPRSGEYGVMMTMGPGAQIETALLRW
jgi:3,5-dihydroxyphenylacetyl-CoA synthase